MSQVTELQEQIAASLYMRPGTLGELLDRDFLKTKSEYGVSLLLRNMERNTWIYQKGETYYTYKKFAESERMSQYELHGLHSRFKRETAEQAMARWSKK